MTPADQAGGENPLSPAQRFLRDLRDGMPAPPPVSLPVWRSTCPACVGRGRLTDVEGALTHNTSCPCCDGMGSVLYRAEQMLNRHERAALAHWRRTLARRRTWHGEEQWRWLTWMP